MGDLLKLSLNFPLVVTKSASVKNHELTSPMLVDSSKFVTHFPFCRHPDCTRSGSRVNPAGALQK